jgi:V/A-type H+-transporting ATPase subunit E
MSIESIINHILDEAGVQRDKIMRDAQQQAELILQEAIQEADKVYQEILAREKSLLEAEKQKLIVNARLESKKNLLKAKQELIDRVIEKLKSEIEKEKFKKYQVLQDKVKEVPEDMDFYLNNLRLEYEPEIAKIIF